MPGCGRCGLPGVRTASDAVEACVDCLKRLFVGRPRRAAQALEEHVESESGGPPVSQCQAANRFEGALSSSSCWFENACRARSASNSGVVQAPVLKVPILIVLDQMVIRVAREGEGVEPERVDSRQSQQAQVGTSGLQMGKVELDQIVAKQEVSALGEAVQLSQRLFEAAARQRKDYGLADIGPYSGERVDTPGLPCDLQVHGEAS